MTCPRHKENDKACNCTYPGCPRHGKCCECLEHHRAKDQLPACYFASEEEKSWDRSIEFFVTLRRNRANLN